ncbi:ead/Ea22-like family protein [Klebsiella pneumoniae]|uniref:ead/Ea22-like family protein n=1 Tax=Klebsiella pneumoniae TaxID=573 RepID=UPI00200EAAA5|nr:ead/Ea22-like family protein [Klebsiella pneumoniae]MCL0588031.1 ead/Ea22-like family protein [Klebsiella pneumoniae]MDW1179540.1 ead/Ea22-like family protein [Klebsiella pneumoniae]
MTDITELAQSLKSAAEKATQGQWIVESQDCRWNVTDAEGVQVALAQQRTATRDDPKQADRTANAEFIALANPANVLALVEELEKAQAENTAGVAGMAESYETIISMFRSRIAELESRTVTVNLASRRLPSDYVDGEFGNDDLAAIHNACRLECKVIFEKYLSAHGIVVKWEAE